MSRGYTESGAIMLSLSHSLLLTHCPPACPAFSLWPQAWSTVVCSTSNTSGTSSLHLTLNRSSFLICFAQATHTSLLYFTVWWTFFYSYFFIIFLLIFLLFNCCFFLLKKTNKQKPPPPKKQLFYDKDVLMRSSSWAPLVKYTC